LKLFGEAREMILYYSKVMRFLTSVLENKLVISKIVPAHSSKSFHRKISQDVNQQNYKTIPKFNL
jgi:hypothetical protein